MDFRLNESEQALQASARRFAEKVVRPAASEIDRSGLFPHELLQQAASLGYLGMPYPESLGGAEQTYQAMGLVVEQIASASMAVAAMLSVHHLCAETVFHFGDGEQRSRLLPTLTSGRSLGAFAFTEAATGSNPADLTTTATPSENGWVLNGHKAFISLGPVAALCIVFAREESGALSAFAVDLPAPGFTFGPALEMLGGHGLPTAPATLTNVSVPANNRLGAPGRGFDILLDVISTGKLCIAHQAVGMAQRALDLAREYAAGREAYGRTIDRMQSIQTLLAEMAVRVESARWLAYRSMAVRDEGGAARHEAALAKLHCSRAVVEVAGMSMQVHGAYGYLDGTEISRIYRDAKLTEIYEGTSEIQRSIIANHLITPPHP